MLTVILFSVVTTDDQCEAAYEISRCFYSCNPEVRNCVLILHITDFEEQQIVDNFSITDSSKVSNHMNYIFFFIFDF